MLDDQLLDETRRQFQESLAREKREQLRDQYGRAECHLDPQLSPKIESEWMECILEFERQFENASTISVRERIGNPSIPPVEEISLYDLERAVEGMLTLLADHGVGVDFLGDWDDLAIYRYITEVLLDGEIDNIRIEGWMSVFSPTTVEYDLQMWVKEFVFDLFRREHEFFLSGLEKQPLYDNAGDPITAAEFIGKIGAVWGQIPADSQVDVMPITTQAAKSEATVMAIIAWQADDERHEVVSFFRLLPSPYLGWDVVQTSLLDDLLARLSGDN